MAAQQHQERLRRALDHFNRGDLEGYLTIYAEDAVMHDYGVEPGLAHIRQFYQGFLGAFPDGHVAVEDLVAEGDKVTCRYTFTGTHQGPLMGIPPTGKAVTIGGISILRFDREQCVERWSQTDFLGLMQQLGAIPMPGADAAADPSALARTIYACFNENRLDDALAYAADDVVVTLMPFGQTFTGREGFRAFMQDFKTAFPDCTVNLAKQWATPNGIVNEFQAQGTHQGPMASPAGAIPPTGRRIDYPVCEVWEVRDGKLARLRNYFDTASMMRQLGLLPEAETA